MNGSETLFKLDGNGLKKNTQKKRKVGRFLENALAERHKDKKQYRILPNEQVYKETVPITYTMRKKRISFIGHILRTSENRLLNKLIGKF